MFVFFYICFVSFCGQSAFVMDGMLHYGCPNVELSWKQTGKCPAGHGKWFTTFYLLCTVGRREISIAKNCQTLSPNVAKKLNLLFQVITGKQGKGFNVGVITLKAPSIYQFCRFIPKIQHLANKFWYVWSVINFAGNSNVWHLRNLSFFINKISVFTRRPILIKVISDQTLFSTKSATLLTVIPIICWYQVKIIHQNCIILRRHTKHNLKQEFDFRAELFVPLVFFFISLFQS